MALTDKQEMFCRQRPETDQMDVADSAPVIIRPVLK